MGERIEWNGGDCPVEPHTRVRGWTRSGKGDWEGVAWPARKWDWKHDPEWPEADLIAYEVVED